MRCRLTVVYKIKLGTAFQQNCCVLPKHREVSLSRITVGQALTIFTYKSKAVISVLLSCAEKVRACQISSGFKILPYGVVPQKTLTNSFVKM